MDKQSHPTKNHLNYFDVFYAHEHLGSFYGVDIVDAIEQAAIIFREGDVDGLWARHAVPTQLKEKETDENR